MSETATNTLMLTGAVLYLLAWVAVAYKNRR